MDLHQHGYGHHAIIEPEDELNVHLDNGLLTIEIHNAPQHRAVLITIDTHSAQLDRFCDEIARAAQKNARPGTLDEVFEATTLSLVAKLDLNPN